LKSYFIFDILSCLPVLLEKWIYVGRGMNQTTLVMSNIFHIAFILKLLRFLQLPRVAIESARLENTLKQRYKSKLILINNFFHLVNTAFLQVLAIHIFATIWITIGLQENGWVDVSIKAGDILTKKLGFLDHNAII